MHKAKPEFTSQYLAGMVITNFMAGHDTITASLTSLLTNTCSRPEVKACLFREVESADDALHIDECANLKYLRACFRESMRLYPVIGMGLPRVVPEPGADLHGYFFPQSSSWDATAGLSTAAGIFSDRMPRNFGPRGGWMPTRSGQKLMNKADLTWGGANRSCPGRHLGELILFKALPLLIKEFDIEITLPGELEGLPYYFISMVTGVKASFKPRRA